MSENSAARDRDWDLLREQVGAGDLATSQGPLGRRYRDALAACGYQGFGSGDHPTGPGCVRPKGHDGPCSTSAATRYELHIRITAFSRDEAMMFARRAWDAIREDAERLTVHEETTMPILKQVGSIGVSRAR